MATAPPTPSTDLTAYYAASGTPPGRFLGAGLADLDDGRGVKEGTVVTEDHLRNMLAAVLRPDHRSSRWAESPTPAPRWRRWPAST